MAERMLWGLINRDAKIISGSGYRVDHTATGVYTILFDEGFNVLPAVVATQLYPNDMNSHGGDALDNAVIVGIANDRFRVKVGDSGGHASDRDFTFIAIGH